ncbi:recombinase family protein [Streptomyces sp. NBC_01340]|uniref:recombinase family protein n=1 Tax=unclassified Streptomyces TaxID=2593676 RepID=UPI0022584DDE|nr:MULTISPECIES: recombinase family protein [unclassified Streptomyces]MCX4455318.1 recombinase family protein [Streptomyces sp. NBC_01719]MCX4494678.1 recombinase family protein [Streptomyces sp. NBC_01728]WSI39707.1 recombinase family protein [Streptomyces sp. NBC_01340]
MSLRLSTAGYPRRTNDDQTGVDRQERICREIAERRGLTIDPAHVFVDNSRSAWSRGRKRPGWDQLLERAQRRPPSRTSSTASTG